MSDGYGISPDRLRQISSTWRSEAGEIERLNWSAFSGAEGEGSAALAAVRECADPAGQAVKSIATRFQTMAGLVDTFATNMEAMDDQIAASLDALTPR
ncbi:hypothetical protein [Antrihabitans spumae]|jgi:hypothetical protein|uniref:WXG100 family type VII secretion target n=1 Tax=Antrihabitans spumae TaxID=3373370 RepID=A0ABW7K7W9_9NOCA